VTVSLTRSSAVVKRPRDAPSRWKYCFYSNSLQVVRIYAVEYCVCKLLSVFHCNRFLSCSATFLRHFMSCP